MCEFANPCLTIMVEGPDADEAKFEGEWEILTVDPDRNGLIFLILLAFPTRFPKAP